MEALTRIGRILSAKVEDLISAAENPEQMLDQVIREYKDEYKSALQELQRSRADLVGLKRDLGEAVGELQKWTGRLTIAENPPAGFEHDPAKVASAKGHVKTQSTLVKTLGPQVERSEGHVAQLESNAQELNAKIDETETEKAALLIRARAASAERKRQESAAGTQAKGGTQSADSLLERMRGKVEGDENAAEAAREVADFVKAPAKAEDEWAAMENGAAGQGGNAALVDEAADLLAKYAPAAGKQRRSAPV